jgi:glycosyltransferase involved in cell wall biosynthesis
VSAVGRRTPGSRTPVRRPVAMLVHAYYEEDPRVRREAESLVARGRPVVVYGLRRSGDAPSAVVDGVRIERIDVQRHQGAGIGTYLAEYVDFFIRAGAALTRDHRRRRYALIQAHSLPDGLVAAGMPLKLVAGVPLVLDLHEAMPEFFRVRFARAANPLAQALLGAQERVSTAMADAVLTVNDALADRLVRLGVPRDKVTVVMNAPSLERFDRRAHPQRSFMADGTLRLVYAGALTPIYEVEVALDALAILAQRRPTLDVVLDVYGRDYAELDLLGMAEAAGVGGRVRFHGRIPIASVPRAVAEADIGLAPTRRSSFTDLSLSTKLFEYAAMGKPVVATALPLVGRTFPAGTVATYTPGDPGSMAEAILGFVDDASGREAAVARTDAIVRDLAWERQAERYAAVIERLVGDGLSSPGRPALVRPWRSGPEPDPESQASDRSDRALSDPRPMEEP